MRALQVDEDLDFLRRMWVAERVGWVLLSAVLLAAVLGAFGSGLLGTVEAEAPGGAYRISYGRFERMQSPATLRVTPARVRGSETVVWIGTSYLDKISVNSIMPEPERMVLRADRVDFHFANDGSSAAAIRFSFEADGAGSATGEVGVDEHESVPIRQFFYP